MSRTTGADDIARALADLGTSINAPVNAASRKALQPMVKRAKANLKANGSVDSGELQRLMTVKRDPKSRKDQPRHMVGPDASKGPGYRKAHLVEFGTAPHLVGKKAHPGAAAKPFLRPAFDETAQETLTIFGNVLGPEIEKAAVRRRKRKAKR